MFNSNCCLNYIIFAHIALIALFSNNITQYAYSYPSTHTNIKYSDIYIYAQINVIDIERGEKKIIKLPVGSKAIEIGGILASAAACYQEKGKLALPDTRAFIRLSSHGKENPIFRGWISKRYSHGISSGRLIFTLHSCSSS
jgi:hypothetical protein